MNKLQKLQLQISSILGGQSSLWDSAEEGEYLTSIGIDPELVQGSLVKPAGIISPSLYADFTTLLDSAPMWISGAQTSSGVYVYGANGSVFSYGTILLDEDVRGTPTSGAGNGMVVYNDYVYLATATNISRLGRVSLTGPTISNDYWVSTLGMSALTNSDYPVSRDVTYPNHVLHAHTDGRVYVLDYDGRNGRLHSFTTDSDGTNGTATFNDMTLPPGLMPMDIKSYGTDLAILCTPQGTWVSGSIPRSSSCVLAFWDGTPGNRAYRYVRINDAIATALANKNGELFVFSGAVDRGVNIQRYLGGYSFETVASLPEGTSPPAGAVDTIGNMLAFGGFVTTPTAAAGVFTLGYRNAKLPSQALNFIARTSNTSDSLPVVSALRFILQAQNPVFGWRTHTTANYGFDKLTSSGTLDDYFRSKVFQIGQRFIIRRIRIPLSAPMQSGVIITPTLSVDNQSVTTALTTINATNYPSNERMIDMQNLAIEGFSNFYLQLAFTGTVHTGVLLPITFDLDIID